MSRTAAEKRRSKSEICLLMPSKWNRCVFTAIAILASLCIPASSAAQTLVYVAGESAQGNSTRTAHLTVINSATGNLVRTLDVGQWTLSADAPFSNPAVAAAPDGSKAYVTAGPELAVVNAGDYRIERLLLGGTLGEVVISANGERLYVASVAPKAVFVLDASSLQPIGSPLLLPTEPRRLALAPDGTRLFVLGTNTVYVVDTTTGVLIASFATRPSAVDLVVHPGGSRFYVGNSTGTTVAPDGNTVSVYDTTTGSEVATVVLPDFRLFIGSTIGRIGQMAILPSGSKLYVPLTNSGFRDLPSAFFRREVVHVLDAGTLGLLDSVTPVQSGRTFTSGIAAVASADGARVFVGAAEGLSSIDATTNAVSVVSPGVVDGDSIALAPAPPCWFELAPRQSHLRAAGGEVVLDVPAPAGCSWSVTAATEWLVLSKRSGIGPSTITVGVPASTGARSGSVTVNGQTVVVDQLIPRVTIETPANGAEVTLPFDVSGWAIEQDARVPQADHSGVERVEVYDYPPTGPPIFLGRIASILPRPDVAAAFGARYLESGFAKRIGRLSAGTHSLVAYARSRHDGQYAAGTVTVTVRRDPLIRIDAPATGATVTQPFVLQGWAADMTSSSGTGVDMIHVVAIRPDGTTLALGNATYGASRPDVAQYFDQPALAPGFEMTVTGLPAGSYTLVAEARSTATGLFERSASVALTVTGTPPIGVIDTPAAGAAVAGTVTVSGWALSQTGVARVAVYRDPIGSEGRQVWLGDATFVEGARPDVAAAFPGFPLNTRAGWGLSVLTNLLPNAGNGPITFHAYAYDVNNNVTFLGSRTVTGTNATSVLPFGTIDTPGQSDTLSGTVTIFGWALTPGANIIAADGSTIQVLVDNLVVGSPVYNQCRGTNGTNFPPPGLCNDDIATTFGPSYRNIAEGSGAIGSFALDTTTLVNGIHRMEWRVTDSAGNVQGIGSRYFYVLNGS